MKICVAAALGACLLLVAAEAQTCIPNGGISAPSGTECAWQADSLYNGTIVLAGASNIQPTALACCASCQSNSTVSASQMPCNAWTWCGANGGCCNLRGGCTNSTTLVPKNACTLLFQEQLEYADESPKPTYTYNATDVAAWGPNMLPNTTAMTSGVYLPTLMDAEQMPGYTALPSQDVTGDDYICPGSDYIGTIVGGCRLNGTVTELAAGCSSDPKCSAFTYQPYGCCSSSMNSNLYESGWRKTGAINPSCTSFLPHTTVYVKQTASS